MFASFSVVGSKFSRNFRCVDIWGRNVREHFGGEHFGGNNRKMIFWEKQPQAQTVHADLGQITVDGSQGLKQLSTDAQKCAKVVAASHDW
jgi:hypothetical protein